MGQIQWIHKNEFWGLISNLFIFWSVSPLGSCLSTPFSVRGTYSQNIIGDGGGGGGVVF
jgi:hypothetical protein